MLDWTKKWLKNGDPKTEDFCSANHTNAARRSLGPGSAVGGKGKKGGIIGKSVGSGGLESRFARRFFSRFSPNAEPGRRLAKAFYARLDQIFQILPERDT